MTLTWDEALMHYSDAQRFQVFTRSTLQHMPINVLLSGLDVPVPTLHFLQNLSQLHLSVWDALVLSIRQIHPQFQEEVFLPLKHALMHATNVVVIYGNFYPWTSPDKWKYLFQMNDLSDPKKLVYLLAQPPATLHHIHQAEQILGMRLPPSYINFLTFTNGLGLGVYPEEFYCVYGVGEARALWDDVVQFQSTNALILDYHEISSNWLQWQNILAYERGRDRETGINTFISDEHVCVPFARTGDEWCFDCSKPNEQGEYPILFWDHELCEATWKYADFASWFTDTVSNLADSDV